MRKRSGKIHLRVSRFGKQDRFRKGLLPKRDLCLQNRSFCEKSIRPFPKGRENRSVKRHFLFPRAPRDSRPARNWFRSRNLRASFPFQGFRQKSSFGAALIGSMSKMSPSQEPIRAVRPAPFPPPRSYRPSREVTVDFPQPKHRAPSPLRHPTKLTQYEPVATQSHLTESSEKGTVHTYPTELKLNGG